MAKNITLQKGLLILETLSHEAREFSLSELSSLTGLGKSQACELLRSLAAEGYVIRNAKNRRYHIGLRTVELSADILARLEVRRAGTYFLYELAQQIGARTSLGVFHRGSILVIELQQPGGIADPDDIGFGDMCSLDDSAMGKVYLAHLPAEKQHKLLSVDKLAEMEIELAEIRRTGLSMHYKYVGEQIISVGLGAVILNARGEVEAVLGARLAWDKWEGCNQTLFRHKVLSSARGLSLALGFYPKSENGERYKEIENAGIQERSIEVLSK